MLQQHNKFHNFFTCQGGKKLAFAPFKKIIQHFALFSKLIREMPLF